MQIDSMIAVLQAAKTLGLIDALKEFEHGH